MKIEWYQVLITILTIFFTIYIKEFILSMNKQRQILIKSDAYLNNWLRDFSKEEGTFALLSKGKEFSQLKLENIHELKLLAKTMEDIKKEKNKLVIEMINNESTKNYYFKFKEELIEEVYKKEIDIAIYHRNMIDEHKNFISDNEASEINYQFAATIINIKGSITDFLNSNIKLLTEVNYQDEFDYNRIKPHLEETLINLLDTFEQYYDLKRSINYYRNESFFKRCKRYIKETFVKI